MIFTIVKTICARVGSVDKFQGQEAPVCILSLCSSYGEYGSRGLAFILDRGEKGTGSLCATNATIVVGMEAMLHS